MREAYEIIEEAMIINWCVVLRLGVQCTLGSTSFFALCFLSLPAQVTSVVLFNIGPVTPNRINGLFDSVTKPRQNPTVDCLFLRSLLMTKGGRVFFPD